MGETVKNIMVLCGNQEADQRLCFRYTDSTITLLPKSEISLLLYSPVCVGSGWNPEDLLSHFAAHIMVHMEISRLLPTN